MERIYTLGGDLAALAGMGLCLVAGVARLAGAYYVLGFAAATLFLGGVALMVAGCLAKLQLLVRRIPGSD
ncbi:MAG TPA: hypothetical protein ENK48_05155 [Gammaproteobacteria bacterium]|nr:hypothetical protein [Gammaproteobacteria bacterium]